MAFAERLGCGLALPMIGAPMFIISGPELVIAQCKAGIIGAFPSLNARGGERLEDWLARIDAALDGHDAAHPDRPAAPYAVNLIVHRSNPRLAEDLAVCARFKVPIVITSLGANRDVAAAVHGWGGVLLQDVTNQHHARSAIDKGADGLVLVAAGAGGHGGTQSPFALMAETRAWFSGPVALAGAIGTGAGIVAAQAMGADFAYVGSPFIATEEARASPEQKQAVIEGTAADIVHSSHFTGVPGNYLRSSILAAGLDPDNLPPCPPDQLDLASEGKVKAWRDIWGAGHGIGAVDAVLPAGALVARFAREHALARAGLIERIVGGVDEAPIRIRR
jgi:nitronate monooxygenase